MRLTEQCVFMELAEVKKTDEDTQEEYTDLEINLGLTKLENMTHDGPKDRRKIKWIIKTDHAFTISKITGKPFSYLFVGSKL